MTMRDLTNVVTEQRLQQITETSSPPADSLATFKSPQPSHLRVIVTSGGCHDFQYLMSLEGSAKVDPRRHHICGGRRGGDGEGGGRDGLGFVGDAKRQHC